MTKRKLALKRLTASDLTLFRWHFENRNAGNQKSINLNRDVFVDVLYPALPDAVAQQEGRLPLDLSIYGPDGKAGINLQRKIVKHGTYKNWRLDGEFVNNPQEEPDRFNSLEPDDLALFDFAEGVVPSAANLLLIQRDAARDKALYAALAPVLGNTRMKAVSEREIEDAIRATSVGSDHPIQNIIVDEALEDAAQGGLEGSERLWHGTSNRYLSRDALDRARRKSENNGRAGEQIVYDYLLRLRDEGQLEAVEWISENSNPIAPYDFSIQQNGEEVLLDVKTTDAEFSRRLHISMNEIRQMANGDEDYQLYRVYEVRDSEAKVRIASDVKQKAQEILVSLANLPEGVNPDSFSFKPEVFDFGPETVIALSEEPEE